MLARWLWPYLRPRLPAFAVALGLALLMAALGAAQPLLTRAIVDRGLIGHRFDLLLAACAGMVLLALCGFALGAVHRRIYVRASGTMLFDLRGAAYAHLLRVPPDVLGRRSVGDLVSRLEGDVAEVQRFSTDTLMSVLGGVFTLLFTAAVMLAMSARLALVVALLLPLQLLVRHFTRERVQRSTRAVREQAGRIGGFMVTTLGGARAVQGAAAEDYEQARFRALNDAYLEKVLRQQMVSYATGAGAALTGHLTTAAVFVAGGLLVLRGEITVGTLVAFVAYLGRGTSSAGILLGLYTGYQRALVSLERVQALFALPPQTERSGAVAVPADAAGALRFEDLGFGYGEAAPVLDNINLEIAAGSKIVIGGDSGVGKSTLADLLRRFLDPARGRILLDGRDLRDYELRSLRRRIAVVEHSPLLFPETVLENLRYGTPQASEAQVLEAARRAGAHAFIAALPQAYATPLGESGLGLSAGQRQRIAVARALLAQPAVLVLDEATSGVDAATARAIETAIDAAFPRCTRIVITHHLQRLEGASLRYRLQDGRLFGPLKAEEPLDRVYAHEPLARRADR